MYRMEIVTTPAAPAAIGPYSQAVKSCGFLFCSGQLGLDPATGNLVSGDTASQARRALENIGAVLAEESLSFSDVIKTTIYLISMDDFVKVNDIYAEIFGQHKPARSTVAVAGLPKGGK